jgi:hypothetical protein
MGPAVAGSSLYLCSQPANIGSVPPSPLVAIFQDAKGITPWPNNVAICDGFGHAAIYATPGLYTLVVVYGGLIQQVYTDQLINELSSTGLPTTGNGSFVVSAQAGITTAPNGDLVVTDGSGNIQDSGTQLATIATTAQLAGLATINNTTFTGTTTIPLANIASMNGVLNANDFVGADIGAQVNAAITQLGAAGGSIYIPAGTYNFTNTIYIPRIVKLFGASSYGTVLNWTPSTGWAIVVADQLGTSIYPEGCIEDLKLVGPTSVDTVGAIYIGGSDAAASTGAGFPASPLVGVDPSASFGDHFSFNRLNISQFGVGVQWGNNGWGNTFMECVLTSNQTSIYFPNTTSDSGERLAFFGCAIQNSGTGLLMASGGSQVDVDFFFTACSFDFNAGNGTTTGWAVNNLNTIWEVNLVNCHVEQQTQWLQNYGYCFLVACNFTQGTGSGTLGYLINNQQANGFSIHGGTFFNGGSGDVFNNSGQPITSFGALLNGTQGTIPLGGFIDAVGNAAFKSVGQVGGQASAGSLGVPVVVYASAIGSKTSVVTNATVFTTTAAGWYRVSGMVWPTTLSSSSWVIYPACTVTCNGGTAPLLYAIGEVIQIGATYANSSVASPQVFYLASGATIGISTVTSSGSNTNGVYSYAVTIERLG